MDFRMSNQSGMPPVVKNLLIINGLFFLGKLALLSRGVYLDQYLAMHYPLSGNFEIWQIITHFFMHADFMHIGLNMFAIWMFGRILENRWGSKRFLNFYILTAIAAAALHFLVIHFQIQGIIENFSPAEISKIRTQGAELLYDNRNYTDPLWAKMNILYNGPVVGASGALFGLLGAMFVLFPNTQLFLLFPPIPIKIKWFVIFYGLFSLYSGIANKPGDNVAHFAHLGGLIAGILIVKYWNKTRRDSFY